MSKRNNSGASSAPLKIQFSRQTKDGKWVSDRVGVAFKSKDGDRLILKLNSMPIGEGILSVWLTPYEE